MTTIEFKSDDLFEAKHIGPDALYLFICAKGDIGRLSELKDPKQSFGDYSSWSKGRFTKAKTALIERLEGNRFSELCDLDGLTPAKAGKAMEAEGFPPRDAAYWRKLHRRQHREAKGFNEYLSEITGPDGEMYGV